MLLLLLLVSHGHLLQLDVDRWQKLLLLWFLLKLKLVLIKLMMVIDNCGAAMGLLWQLLLDRDSIRIIWSRLMMMMIGRG